jgi:amino acid adenylation domain-containing protein
LWFIDQLAPGNAIYNIPGAVKLEGRLDLVALERVINEIVRRHEALRTRIEVEGGEAVQVIEAREPGRLDIQDLMSIPQKEREEEVKRRARAEAEAGFDLSRGPLLRVKVLKLEEEEHVLLFTLHHIVSDGWSMGVLVREVCALYEAMSEGKGSPLPELEIQYADYAVWQRKYLTGGVLEDEVGYWREQLEDARGMDLLTDYGRPAVPSYQGGRERIELGNEVYEGLRRLGQRVGATLYMVLMAAFKVVLMRYSGEEDVVVGTVIANRSRREVEGLIGFFVNTLVMRTDLSGNPSLRELVEREREVALGAYAHQEVPFEKLVKEINPERNLSRNPLFQVMMLLQNTRRSEVTLKGLKVMDICREMVTAKFDLTLDLAEARDNISGDLEYRQDLYRGATIRRMARCYERVVEAIVRDPEQRIQEIELMSEAEKKQTLEEWNETERSYGEPRLLHEMVREQAERRPESVAVVCGDEQVSYEELNKRADRLARFLRGLGTEREGRVGICVWRGVAMVESVLGVMKAGAAYVPMDPIYPVERLNYMAVDGGCEVVISDKGMKSELERVGCRVIDLEADGEEIKRESEQRCKNPVDGYNLAYLIYTSGSTGKPKGVMISHRSISNRIRWGVETLPLDENDALLQLASFSFDVSVWEIFTSLVSGGRLVLPKPDEHQSPEVIGRLIQDHKITVVNFVPQMLDLILDEPVGACFASLKWVTCGGEALPLETLRRFVLRFDTELYNFYGPTESSVDSAFWRCELEEDQTTAPIGRPIGNVQAYVLDSRMKPVLIGVPGELYIGGVALARGYQRSPDLTAEMFVPNPFSKERGARLYKTGDLTRYREDGNLEYLGRIDQQVKIRGFRIELEEIEAVLRQHPAVREAVVISKEQESTSRVIESAEIEYAQRIWPGEPFFERSQGDHRNILQLIDEIDALSEEEVELALHGSGIVRLAEPITP